MKKTLKILLVCLLTHSAPGITQEQINLNGRLIKEYIEADDEDEARELCLKGEIKDQVRDGISKSLKFVGISHNEALKFYYCQYRVFIKSAGTGR